MLKPKLKTISRIHIETYTDCEHIEDKVRRVKDNNEPISDTAPEIFTAKKDGVLAAYNIRTDKWDIALNAMEQANAEKWAKSVNWYKEPEKVNNINPTDGTPSATQAEA